MEKTARLFFDSPKRNLLLVAAILQITVVLSLFTMGRLGVAPTKIDDRGLLCAALPDTRDYDREAKDSVLTLKQSGIHAWLFSGHSAHVKLYSLSYLVLGPMVGNNILSAEPVNLCCYLAIVILVFKIGKELFDQAAGSSRRGRGCHLAFIPLAQRSDFERPIFLAAMLSLVLVMTMWLTRKLLWRMGLATGLIGTTAIWLIYATRAAFWGVIALGVILIAAVLLILRMVHERRVLAGNLLSVLAVLLLAVGVIFLNRTSLTPRDQLVLPPETTNVIPANQKLGVVTLGQPPNQSSSAPVAELAQRKDNPGSQLTGDGNQIQRQAAHGSV